jgi:hypothetical protein
MPLFHRLTCHHFGTPHLQEDNRKYRFWYTSYRLRAVKGSGGQGMYVCDTATLFREYWDLGWIGLTVDKELCQRETLVPVLCL